MCESPGPSDKMSAATVVKKQSLGAVDLFVRYLKTRKPQTINPKPEPQSLNPEP